MQVWYLVPKPYTLIHAPNWWGLLELCWWPVSQLTHLQQPLQFHLIHLFNDVSETTVVAECRPISFFEPLFITLNVSIADSRTAGFFNWFNAMPISSVCLEMYKSSVQIGIGLCHGISLSLTCTCVPIFMWLNSFERVTPMAYRAAAVQGVTHGTIKWTKSCPMRSIT